MEQENYYTDLLTSFQMFKVLQIKEKNVNILYIILYPLIRGPPKRLCDK